MGVTKIDAAALSAAVTAAASVVRKTATLPVLSAVRLDSEGGALRVTGTDLDRFVDVSVPAFFSDLWTAIVPAQTLGEILRTLEGEVILAPEGGGLRIECGRYTAVLDSMPADEWPTPREEKPSATITLGGAALANANAWVAPCASTELSRPSIIGVCMVVEGEEVLFQATDGTRAARLRQLCQASEDVRLHVPVAAMATLARLFGDADDVLLEIAEGHMLASAGDVRAMVRLAADPFVSDATMERIFGVEAVATIEIDAAEWRMAIQRVQVTAGEKVSAITLDVRDDGAHELRAARDTLGRASQVVGGALTGAPVTVGLNARQVLHALTSLKAHETLTLRVRDERSPVVIEATSERHQHVTMPMREVAVAAAPARKKPAA